MSSPLDRPLPHPDPAELERSARAVLDWSLRQFTTLPDRPLGRSAPRAELEALLAEPPPEQGGDFRAALAEFERKVAPYQFHTDHPRFLAFIPSAPTFPAVLGDWLATAAHCFTGVWDEAAGAVAVELRVLDWFKTFLGYPPQARGTLTAGGSEANLTALAAARARLAFDERRRAVLYVSGQQHHSIDRAAHLLGLHPEQVRPLPADDDFRSRPAALAESARRDRSAGLRPWAAVGTAGSTNTGTVDPLRPLAEVCRAEGLWLHVDAAYGWPAVLTERGRTLLDGIAEADSVTLDPHKWFAQPYEAGAVLVRDGRHLADAFRLRADYLQDWRDDGAEFHFTDHGIALTRRLRALKIWLALKVHGVGWYRELVERGFRLAELAEQVLRRAGVFEILVPPRLSIVCFRYVPPGRPRADEELDRINLAVVAALRRGGRATVSSTRLRGRVALRMCFVNWRTTSGDVEAVVRVLAEAGEDVCRGGRGASAP